MFHPIIYCLTKDYYQVDPHFPILAVEMGQPLNSIEEHATTNLEIGQDPPIQQASRHISGMFPVTSLNENLSDLHLNELNPSLPDLSSFVFLLPS